ncbi:MAG: outer membrane protein transport protein [Candidatus Eisenbacteria sp.]|nr:outer membrane protein transport protein [Candidatus Eisenbacteria bacterium]
MRLRTWIWMFLLLSLMLTTAAEGDEREITVTRRFGTGPRSMGMGGASVALVDDGSALFLNPAGLARVRRIELAAGLRHQSYDLDTRYRFSDDGYTCDPISGESVATRFGSLTGVYPFPTYRGSAVVAAGVDRIFSSDMEMVYRGRTEDGTFSELESYSVTGGVSAWAVGGAIDISPSASLGLSVLFWDGHDDVLNTFDCESCVGEADSVDFHETIATDYSAFSAVLGLQLRLGANLGLGFSIESPVEFTLEGTAARYGLGAMTYYYEDKIRLPFSFVSGAALRLGAFSFAGDVRYTDWRQLDYEGILRDDGQFQYRSTTQWHFGTEYLLPFYPMRLRAGYYTEPLAYRSSLELEKDRSFYTFGAGILIDDILTIDAAVVIGDLKWWSDEITDREILRDESFTRVLVSAAYRF